MTRNILETLLGFIVVGVAIGFVAFGLQFVDKDTGKDTYTAYAYFNDVGGLKSGADVRVSGVLVGRVDHVKINMEVFKAEVKMQIANNIVLPQDTLVAITDASLLGGKYLRLEMGSSSDLIKNGDILTNVADVVSLEQLLGKLIFLGTQ